MYSNKGRKERTKKALPHPVYVIVSKYVMSSTSPLQLDKKTRIFFIWQKHKEKAHEA
jgi:hypothetical protein